VVPFVTTTLRNDVKAKDLLKRKRMRVVGECYVLGAMEGQVYGNELDMERLVLVFE
jgi:hypothetical protein